MESFILIENETKVDATEQFAQLFDFRVAVLGNVDSGKSTLIGVLTGGEKDNGRGLAREKVVTQKHELESGRTSTISHHLLGFDKKGKPQYQKHPANSSHRKKNESWNQVLSSSASIVTFIDLAGHEKYLKTTMSGLCSVAPQYALVVVNSLAGVTKMTKEHLGLLLAKNIPFACILTKVDMAPANVYTRNLQTLIKILRSVHCKKLPLTIREAKDIKTVTDNIVNSRVCPIFPVSAVTGQGLEHLNQFIYTMSRHEDFTTQTQSSTKEKLLMTIDDSWSVNGAGLVVSGRVNSGTIHDGMSVEIGPLKDGSFQDAVIKTVYFKRVHTSTAPAGAACSVSLRSKSLKTEDIRRGMILKDKNFVCEASMDFFAEILILHHPTTIKTNYQAVIHCNNIRQSAQIKAMYKVGAGSEPPETKDTSPQDKSVQDKSVQDKSVQDKSVQVKSVQDKSPKDKSVQDKSIEDKSVQDTSIENKSPKDKSVQDTSIENKSPKDKSVQDKSSKDKSPRDPAIRTGDKAIVKFTFLRYPEYVIPGSEFIFREGTTKGVGHVLSKDNVNLKLLMPETPKNVDDEEKKVHVEDKPDSEKVLKDIADRYALHIAKGDALNLDVTAIIAYISDVTHGLNLDTIPDSYRSYCYALEEKEKPGQCLQQIIKLFEGKTLFICEQAYQRCLQILEANSMPTEKARFEELMKKVIRVPNVYPLKDIKTGRDTAKITPIIFETGKRLGMPTMTSCLKFPRYALNQGIKYEVVECPARCLRGRNSESQSM